MDREELEGQSQHEGCSGVRISGPTGARNNTCPAGSRRRKGSQVDSHDCSGCALYNSGACHSHPIHCRFVYLLYFNGRWQVVKYLTKRMPFSHLCKVSQKMVVVMIRCESLQPSLSYAWNPLPTSPPSLMYGFLPLKATPYPGVPGLMGWAWYSLSRATLVGRVDPRAKQTE